MVQLRTQKTALVLYGVLLVLPTLVLGGLQWRQLELDYQSEMNAVPDKAEGAATRFRDVLADRLSRLIESEEQRPFTDYCDVVCATGANISEMTPLTSPLLAKPRPPHIQAWFAFDLYDEARAQLEGKGRQAPIDLWAGRAADSERAALEREFLPLARSLCTRYANERSTTRASRWGDVVLSDLSLDKVALNRLHKREMDCLQYQLEFMAHEMVSVQTTRFHLQFIQDEHGTPRVFATRRVLMPVFPGAARYGSCMEPFGEGLQLVQGFFIDPQWLFHELPDSVAHAVLDPTQRYVPAGESPPAESVAGDVRPQYNAAIALVRDLGIETDTKEQEGYAPMFISVDTAWIADRSAVQRLRFLGLAAMLAVSLATGIMLLLRSVRRDLEQAARTENFVAAVTHELRTPLSAIKLHGEMLLDGWAREPEKQQEYYRRILRETDRLSTLVERVLEKSRLTAGSVRPVADDLNRLIEALEATIAQSSPAQGRDVEFALTEGLPLVMLTQEAVTSIVVNLVENARKYAPVDLSKPGAEPIRVQTRRGRDHVVLEVSDRGPGVAPEEAPRIFEAFYRVGNEATRTSRGTGLGLHLVALQAKAVGGSVGVLPRQGGGATFWVRFPLARGAELGDVEPSPTGSTPAQART